MTNDCGNTTTTMVPVKLSTGGIIQRDWMHTHDGDVIEHEGRSYTVRELRHSSEVPFADDVTYEAVACEEPK